MSNIYWVTSSKLKRRSKEYISSPVSVNDSVFLTRTGIKNIFRQTCLCAVISASLLNEASAAFKIENGMAITVSPYQYSPWNVADDLMVGYEGSGSLRIGGGGIVNSINSYIGIGDVLAYGTASVSGVGSQWNNSGSLYVSQLGFGSLAIKDGGVVNNTSGYVGSDTITGKYGVLEVYDVGSQWNSSADLNVGVLGNGVLRVYNKGVVSNDAAFIGVESGSMGIVEVHDAGSQWNSRNNLVIGHSGEGTLKISDSGVVSSNGVYIGKNTSSIGVANVTGAGSQLNGGNSLYVGYLGNGSLTINGGGVVNNDSSKIGSGVSSSGIVSVSDSGSQWNNNGTLVVGQSGNGALTISDGGIVNNAVGFIAARAGSMGNVEVTGTGSQWNNSIDLIIAGTAQGSLTISDRAEVSSPSVMIAYDPTGVGTLNIGSGNLSGTLTATSITGGSGSATVNFNHTDDIDFSPQMTGNLTVNKVNQGTTTLTSVNDYVGVTTVSAGTLQARTSGAFSAASDFMVDTAGQLNLAGYDQTVASLNNSGVVSFNGAPGAVLSVSGNYTGNNGLLNFNTVLNDDSSATDKMVVAGNTAGVTRVSVTNVGGHGATTLNGIELVQVNGTSDGEFVQQGRIVAGAYDYTLARGAGANTGNWYLTNTAPTPVNPTPDPNTPPTPIPTPGPTMLVRPEAGSYMANIAAAGKLFNLRLEDREGRAENSSMWLRQQGSRTKFRDTSGQIKTSTNTYVIQGGGEVAETGFTDTDRLGLGLMLGYGESDSQSGNSHTGYDSKGKVNGYSAGVYGTWYQDAKTLNGAYIDSWLQYSMLDGEVNGDQLSGESYDINGLSASIESGYRIPVYQGENGHVFVTPQAQIIWSGIYADDHTEANGTRVTSDDNNNVQTRLGVKLSRDGVSAQDKGSDKLFTVYAEVNWLHNTEQAGAVMDGVSVKQAGNTNVGELKLGAEGQLNKHVNLWTNVAQQMGDKGYSDTALTVGFKYRF